MSLTPKEAQELGSEIARNSSGVSIKVGSTNGNVCLHLTKRGSSEGTTTIYERSEWFDHPENRTQKKHKRRKRTVGNEPALIIRRAVTA